MAGAALVMRAAGVGGVDLYPRLELAVAVPEGVLCALILLGAATPFAGRSARLGVVRA